MMYPSAACVEIITEFEGLRLKAYQDSGGVWTIGYGHTKAVSPDDVITLAVAQDLLMEDCRDAAEMVNKHFGDLGLKQHEFDALCSLAFNLRPGKVGVADGWVWLKNGKHSTLYRLLRSGDNAGAAVQFERWINVAGKPSRGLRRRRAAERAMFEGRDWRAAAAAVK